MANKLSCREFEPRMQGLAQKNQEPKLIGEDALITLYQAIEQCPSMIMITDSNSTIEYVNPKFTEISGYTLKETIGTKAIDLGMQPIKEENQMWLDIKSGKEWRGEFHNKKKNGKSYKESASISAVKNYAGVITHFIKVAEDITEHRQAERVLKKQTNDLNKRVKELNCLFGISKLVETPHVPLDKIIKGILALIPPAWQHPENTCARIILGDEEYKTANFIDSAWKQACDIILDDKPVGTLEVHFLERKADSSENPFFKEEGELIKAIAERLASIIEYKHAERELQIKTKTLEEVNTALRVLLRTIDEDKFKLQEQLLANVKNLVFPHLAAIANGSLDHKQKISLAVLKSNLKNIISSFSQKLSSESIGLTTAEIKIANLITEGKTTKEIAALHHLSTRTIETHRDNIRRKCGLKGRKVNLQAYLASLY